MEVFDGRKPVRTRGDKGEDGRQHKVSFRIYGIVNTNFMTYHQVPHIHESIPKKYEYTFKKKEHTIRFPHKSILKIFTVCDEEIHHDILWTYLSVNVNIYCSIHPTRTPFRIPYYTLRDGKKTILIDDTVSTNTIF